MRSVVWRHCAFLIAMKWVSKGLLTPISYPDCYAATLLPQSSKYSKSADLLRKSLLSHIWRVPSSKALSCKHEQLFDLLTLVSLYICIQNSTLILPTRNCLCGHDAGRACMLTLWIKNEHPVFCTECPISLLHSNYSLFNY